MSQSDMCFTRLWVFCVVQIILLWLARGSLELGDMLSDVSAAPMEMTLLGVPGKV